MECEDTKAVTTTNRADIRCIIAVIYCWASFYFFAYNCSGTTTTTTTTTTIITDSVFCSQFWLFCHFQTWLEMAMHSFLLFFCLLFLLTHGKFNLNCTFLCSIFYYHWSNWRWSQLLPLLPRRSLFFVETVPTKRKVLIGSRLERRLCIYGHWVVECWAVMREWKNK